MPYVSHKASYNLGERQLEPGERVVVGTRGGAFDPKNDPSEPRRVAKHLGVSPEQPSIIIQHQVWQNGEYMPRWNMKQILEGDGRFKRYADNYQGPDGSRSWGQSLRGRTVYLVHTLSNNLSNNDLASRVQKIASNAKYHGAESVVLLAFTLDNEAQERGIHDKEHPRLQTDKARYSIEGEPHALYDSLKQLAVAGVDAIVTPSCHDPRAAATLCDIVNEELAPMNQVSRENRSTMRYKLSFYNVSLAPVVAMLLLGNAPGGPQFNTSDNGKNLIIMGPDAGILPYVREIARSTGLSDVNQAIMSKMKSADGGAIELLRLEEAEGLTTERGIEGMDIVIVDDMIRSGKTMSSNIDVLYGITLEGLSRDPRIRGTPNKVSVITTRTNFGGESVGVLSNPRIEDVIVTNADPRGFKRMGRLSDKTSIVYINFLMAEAAKAIERGEDPNAVLTAGFIKDNRLLKVEAAHDHRSNAGSSQII
ncbi:hypothetical protein COV20_02715 [Candidatus Woesearchaeota archaeon CG10_big_fil_rev_8_21_14_0_10_45_16]|nr:MAG: hypothetical protein COV20_02715 [Candidatus Woesearchaeota archaeon CG10_big_fil_rev_8_21_14_0_10_45_16]